MTQHQQLDVWVKQWRSPMLRFARLHLSQHEDAEDAVQETFAAALTSAALNDADPRRYLFGILRNKVMDKLRERYRNPVRAAVPEDDFDQLLFDAGDHWHGHVAPAPWQTPEQHTEQGQFFQVLDICLTHLPEKAARVFTLKEFMDSEADEICTLMNISKSDYWQSMSRARKQIHLCLNQRWLGGETLP